MGLIHTAGTPLLGISHLPCALLLDSQGSMWGERRIHLVTHSNHNHDEQLSAGMEVFRACDGMEKELVNST